MKLEDWFSNSSPLYFKVLWVAYGLIILALVVLTVLRVTGDENVSIGTIIFGAVVCAIGIPVNLLRQRQVRNRQPSHQAGSQDR